MKSCPNLGSRQGILRSPSKIQLLLLSLLPVLAVSTGCASTRMRSFADPDFKDQAFENLVVAVRFRNLDQQADAEDIFVRKFSKIQGTCRRSLDIILPTRKYSDDELFKVLQEHDIDGVMMIWETDYWEDERRTPQITTSHSSGSFSANTYYSRNNASTYGSGQQTTYSFTSGGDTITLPRVRHKVELFDVSTKKMAWTGGSLTKGNGYARFHNLIDALATETKKELLRHGLIKMPEKQR